MRSMRTDRSCGSHTRETSKSGEKALLLNNRQFNKVRIRERPSKSPLGSLQRLKKRRRLRSLLMRLKWLSSRS
jgi:hypothetical protein